MSSLEPNDRYKRVESFNELRYGDLILYTGWNNIVNTIRWRIYVGVDRAGKHSAVFPKNVTFGLGIFDLSAKASDYIILSRSDDYDASSD